MKHRVLVTGAGGGSGLYAIKILKQSTPHTVIACDAIPYSTGLYLAHHYSLIPPANDTGFLPTVEKLVEEYNIDIILPNVDEELLIFAQNKASLKSVVVVSEPETIRICNDKLLTAERLSGVVPCPDSSDVLPCVLKPRSSRGSANVFIANNKEEFDLYLKLLQYQGYSKNSILAQEYLPGREYTVDALCDSSGKMIVAVPRERLLVKGGISQVGRTVRNEKIIDSVKKITETIRFFGPINLQFKENQTGIPCLIEINPRCSGGLPIVYAAGVNIVKLAIQIVDGEELPNIDWKEQTVYRYFEELVP